MCEWHCSFGPGADLLDADRRLFRGPKSAAYSYSPLAYSSDLGENALDQDRPSALTQHEGSMRSEGDTR